TLAREPRLDRLILLEAAFGVDTQHLARSELRPSHPPMAGDIDRASFGGTGNQAVLACRITQRAQPVSIERGTDPNAIGKDQSSRTIPRLHQAGVVTVEVADRRIDVETFPGFRNQHGEYVTDVSPAANEQLQGVIEHR